MTRLICCLSGKGGVGKTTLVSNLSAALADFGENTIAIDANLTTPNLGLHTGLHLVQNTLHNVLKGQISVNNALYPHPYGFTVIPASMNLNDLKGVDPTRLAEVSFSLLGKANYILLDGAAGLGKEALSALAASDEIIIVTNPSYSAITDAVKVVKIAQNSNMKILGAVVNRVKGENYELSQQKIEELMGVPVIANVPEDENVSRSQAEKKLLFEYNPSSPAAIEIKKLASRITGKPYQPPSFNPSIFERLFIWLRS